VNERIEELAPGSSFVEFVCECTFPDCTERVSLTLEEYEAIRRESNSFFVVAGHEVPAVEAIVASTDRDLVVAKRGEGAKVAETLDPRRKG
jgi:hypothetical protein